MSVTKEYIGNAGFGQPASGASHMQVPTGSVRSQPPKVRGMLWITSIPCSQGKFENSQYARS